MWLGVIIALPSGAVVALAILAGNTESLVGVAISAALLEPSVNAVSMPHCTVILCINYRPKLKIRRQSIL